MPSPPPALSRFTLLELLSGFFPSPWGGSLAAAAAAAATPSVTTDSLFGAGGGGKRGARGAAARTAVQVAASASSPSPRVAPPARPQTRSPPHSLSFSGLRSVLASAVLLANATSCNCCCEMP